MTNKSFSDLTKIDVPFGELDIETKLALHRAFYEGGKIESYGERGKWFLASNPGWYLGSTYRLQPEPLPIIKPSINWDHVSKEYNWLAVDSDGDAFVYKNKPYTNGYGWSCKTGGTARVRVFSSYSRGNALWQDSLVQRPVKDEDVI